MKFIIDVDEQYYKDLKKITPYVCSEAITAIQKGTPLPKGYGRLIDGSKLEQFTQLPNMTLELLAIDIFESPTIIEADKGE